LCVPRRAAEMEVAVLKAGILPFVIAAGIENIALSEDAVREVALLKHEGFVLQCLFLVLGHHAFLDMAMAVLLS
jgi:hypothetical protein